MYNLFTGPLETRGSFYADLGLTQEHCTRVKQFLADAKIWRLGRPGKLRGNETENVFLSWLGWLY